MERIGTKIVIVLSLFMGLALTVGSFFVNYHMTYSETGALISIRENPAYAVLLFGVLCILEIFYLIYKRGSVSSKVLIAAELSIMVWMAAGAVWWLMAADRMPTDDQAYIYGFASYFLEGDYTGCKPGGYLSMYPHQAGLIFLTQQILRFAGGLNYHALQWINLLFLPAMVPAVKQLVQILYGENKVTLYTLLLLGLCFPLIFYVPYVYGEIPSFFFVVLLVLFAVKYEKKEKTTDFAGLILAAVMAYLCRNMRMVFLIAVLIYLVLAGITKKQKKLIVAGFLTIVIPYLAAKGVLHYYEDISGFVLDNGLPSILWVCMGMQEGAMGAGWFNNYPVRTFIDTGYDQEAAIVNAKTVMGIRLRDLTHPITYGISFYARKFLSQWANPSYNGLECSYQYMTPLSGVAESIRNGRGNGIMYVLMDIWQVVLYAGFTLSVWFRRRQKDISGLLPEIALIGGVLISLLWESNSRYIFTYVLMIIPSAARGIYALFEGAVHSGTGTVPTESRNE